MVHLRSFTGVVGAFLLSLFLVSCASTPTPISTQTPQSSFPLTIWDSLGEAITFTEPPQRIVSFSPAQTEIFFALGVSDRVVGRDSFSDHPPKTQDIPAVGDAFNLDLERIVALQPDLVYVSFASPKAKIQELNIPVLYLDAPADLDGVQENILLMGRLLKHEPQAQALIEEIRKQIQAVESRISDVQVGPRSYYELDPGLFTTGRDTFIGDLFRRLKAQNIAAAAQGPYPQLSNEFIVAQDPEVILLGDSAQYGNGNETPETIAARPGWEGIIAVKKGRIFAVMPNIVARPGPRIGQGMEHLARLLYPDLFE